MWRYALENSSALKPIDEFLPISPVVQKWLENPTISRSNAAYTTKDQFFKNSGSLHFEPNQRSSAKEKLNVMSRFYTFSVKMKNH